MKENTIIKLESILECNKINRSKAFRASLVYCELPNNSAYISKNRFGKHGIVSKQELDNFIDSDVEFYEY